MDGLRARDRPFSFLDEAFGDGREMNAFVADLAARPSTAQFVAKFGNDSYYAHTSAVAAATDPQALRERIASLDLQAAAAAQAEAQSARGCGPCSGC